jgi:hypothetical protein
MRKNNSTIGLFYLIIMFFSLIFLSIKGKHEIVIYYLALFIIPLIIFGSIKLLTYNTSNKALKATTKISKVSSSYKIKENVLTGDLISKLIPNDLIELTNLERLYLKTYLPIDLSDIINNNNNLKEMILEGPFLVENLKIEENQIQTLVIVNNPYCKNILQKFEHQKSITSLRIVSNSIMKFNDFNFLTENLYSLTVKCKLQLFPYELLNNKNLISLDLSDNEISVIHENELNITNYIESNLKYINLNNNNIENIALNLFKIKSLKNISLRKNPINRKILKLILKEYYKIVNISHEQFIEMRKDFNYYLRKTTRIFKQILAIFFITFISYLFFNNLIASFILFMFMSIILINAYLD